MIDKIITFSVKHRWIVIATAAVVGILGAWAFSRTPVDAIPDLSENQVLVFAQWKGRSPRELDDQVTYPLTLALQGLKNVRVVRASSEVGFALVSVIFKDRADFDEARRSVGEQLVKAKPALPEDASVELAPDAPATGQIFWYTIEGGGLDLGELRTVQDALVKPRLGAVEGVAEVASVGGFLVEYEIAVNPRRMQALGVSLTSVVEAVRQSNSSAGGHVLRKGGAEFVVRGVGLLGSSTKPGDERIEAADVLRDLENLTIAPIDANRPSPRVGDVAKVSLAPGYRRGVLEKDGSEVVGGVVLSAHGENPLETARRIKTKLKEIAPSLPSGVRIVSFYDREPIVEGTIRTVTRAVEEAMISAAICVLVVLLHVRTSLVVVVTLPLAALSSFLIMGVLRWAGIVKVEANAMSLAGVAISIGVLVDSSIVMAENAMHHLKRAYGDRKVQGDVRSVVLPACLAVGRPIVSSIAIMLLSFLPVFALGGIEGKMFRPLAFTKSFALLAVAVLAITLVPALCTIFIRGRLRSEQESPLVRGVTEVYRPTLNYLLDHPLVLALAVGVPLLLGLAPLGHRPTWLFAFLFVLTSVLALGKALRSRVLGALVVIAAALAIDLNIKPIEREIVAPLDEGMVMDMPISVPGMSTSQAVDDLKARDMVLCRFPEVEMVVGKAGRADTPTDPAPLDMIETMVNLRPREFWPSRKIRKRDLEQHVRTALEALTASGIVQPPANLAEREALVAETLSEASSLFDSNLRAYAYSRNAEILSRFRGQSPSLMTTAEATEPGLVEAWRNHVRSLDRELLDRASILASRLAADGLLERMKILDPRISDYVGNVRQLRSRMREDAVPKLGSPAPARTTSEHHHGGSVDSIEPPPPEPKLELIYDHLTANLRKRLMLWKTTRDELFGYQGEIDQAVSTPGWTNVWTMPIQNRVDMLSSGVNTLVGVRVLGERLDDLATTSEAIAQVVKGIQGAVDVSADPIRGKPHIEVRFKRNRCAELGVNVAQANAAIEAALAGKQAAVVIHGRDRRPVVVRLAKDYRSDEEDLKDLLVPARGKPGAELVPIGEIAEVLTTLGPTSIKSENGLLRNYVRMNVYGRDPADFVAEAKEKVYKSVPLPSGVHVEWTGRFEHEAESRTTLMYVFPISIALMFAVLLWTYRDAVDAALVMTAVPGAIAGGLFFLWLLGLKLSVAAWVGFIACFGMAASTGIIMLVYLREAIELAGGLSNLDQAGLERARSSPALCID